MTKDAQSRELPEPLVKALVEVVHDLAEYVAGPSFQGKHKIGDALENVVIEILAEVDRRIVRYPR